MHSPLDGPACARSHSPLTLERELTRAILDGRVGDGARVAARHGEAGSIELDVAVSQPVAD